MSVLDQVLARLNPEQHRAAITTSPKTLVLAGAGSGKTSVLVSRIAHLQLNERVGTSNMLALTFTRLAAHEMKERVGKLIGAQLSKNLTAGTFHSFCVGVLRRWGVAVGLDSDFSIYDQDDRKAILESIASDLHYGSKVKLSQLDPWAKDQPDSSYKAVSDEYLYRLRQNNATDLDGLLMLTCRLLETTDAAYWLHNTYTHVFVDEYQDTDDRQERILRVIKPKNLFVVGDPSQAIYGWRGARIENILTFEERNPGCEVIRLERNYRSTKPILAIANRVIADAPYKAPLQLWTDKEADEGLEPIVHHLSDDKSEAGFVANAVLCGCLDHLYDSLSEVAILARTNAQVETMREALEAIGVSSFVVSNSGDPLNVFDVRRVLDYMAYLCNPRDGRALFRIVNWPERRIAELDMMRLRREATMQGRHVCELIEDATNLRDDLTQATEHHDSNPWTSARVMFDCLASYVGLRVRYEVEGRNNRVDQLEAALAAIERWQDRQAIAGEPIDPETFLRWLHTRDIQDRFSDQTEDAVRIMTIHAAKGLEWDHVFLAGCNEGILPSKRGDLEEERRLFYVAVTRARETLCLSYFNQREGYGGKVQRLQRSQFLESAEVTV